MINFSTTRDIFDDCSDWTLVLCIGIYEYTRTVSFQSPDSCVYNKNCQILIKVTRNTKFITRESLITWEIHVISYQYEKNLISVTSYVRLVPQMYDETNSTIVKKDDYFFILEEQQNQVSGQTYTKSICRIYQWNYDTNYLDYNKNASRLVKLENDNIKYVVNETWSYKFGSDFYNKCEFMSNMKINDIARNSTGFINKIKFNMLIIDGKYNHNINAYLRFRGIVLPIDKWAYGPPNYEAQLSPPPPTPTTTRPTRRRRRKSFCNKLTSPFYLITVLITFQFIVT